MSVKEMNRGQLTPGYSKRDSGNKERDENT